VKIQLNVLAGIVGHARHETPLECCGLLVGSGDLIDEYVETRNVRQSEVVFEIDAAEHFAVIKRTRRMGRAILGAYHSHPRSPARPSPTDLAQAYPEMLYVIVSLSEEPPDIQAYRLVGERFDRVPFAAVP
jgi:proteasome lid subunit RPN8/RPN11